MCNKQITNSTAYNEMCTETENQNDLALRRCKSNDPRTAFSSNKMSNIKNCQNCNQSNPALCKQMPNICCAVCNNNNNNNKNNNNSSSNNNNSSSSKSKSNNKVNCNNTTLKRYFATTIFAFCIILTPNFSTAIPRHRLGRDLLYHPQHRQQHHHVAERSIINDIAAQITEARKQSEASSAGLIQLMTNYSRDVHIQPLENLTDSLAWNALNLPMPILDDEMNMDSLTLEMVQDNIYQIRKTLLVMNELLMEVRHNRTMTQRIVSNLEEHERNITNSVFNRTYDAVGMSIRDVKNIISAWDGNFGTLETPDMSEHEELKTRDRYHVLLVLEHLKILLKIDQFYEKLLKAKLFQKP